VGGGRERARERERDVRCIGEGWGGVEREREKCVLYR
jgi:hypothetical protein